MPTTPRKALLVPDDLYTRVTAAATAQGCALEQWVADVLEDAVREHEHNVERDAWAAGEVHDALATWARAFAMKTAPPLKRS